MTDEPTTNREQETFEVTVSFDAVIGIFPRCPNCNAPLHCIELEPVEVLLVRRIIASDCPNCGELVIFKLDVIDPINPTKLSRAVKKRATEMRTIFRQAKEELQ